VAFIPGLVLKLHKKKRRFEVVFSEPGGRKNREGLSLDQELLVFGDCEHCHYSF